MKRKITALVLALTFCLSLSVTAFAETVTDDGYTSGDSRIHSYARLYVDSNRCEAETWAALTSIDLTFNTSVIYYYTDTNGMTQTDSGSGSDSTGAGTLNYNSGIYATSHHRVRGPSSVGSWSTNLEAYA